MSEYVQLKRAGRNFKGLSPFTHERTPSFVVSPEKQIWHDFSSGKGGDVISFIEQVEGLDFKAALELLARKAGIELTEYASKKPGSSAQSRRRLYDAVELAVTYYQRQLLQAEAPLRYLREKRGYSKQTILDFRFGYSPQGSDNLARYLRSKGVTDAELLSAGLGVKRNGGLIDMFRNRVMIPLSDAEGRPVGFTARQLSDEPNSPKYINTPATSLYDKSRQLFGFHQAKEHIRKSGFVVVVEGNLDVVASHQAGVKQVVASAGTALTQFHLKALRRFTADVRLAFDEDRAGQEAAERTVPLAQAQGIELSIIEIPSGKDPDELIKKDVALWRETVGKQKYMIDWLMDKASAELDLSTAIGKKQFTDRLVAIVRSLADVVEREHYVRKMAQYTATSYEAIQKKVDQSDSGPKLRMKPVTVLKRAPGHQEKQLLREQHLLAIIMGVPEFRKYLDGIPPFVFSEQAAQLLRTTKNFTDSFKDDEYGKMVALLFEETYQHTERVELEYQIEQLSRRLVQYYITSKKTELLTKLKQASTTDGEHALLKELAELDRLMPRERA